MPFDINSLPKPKPKAKLPAGTSKKDDLGSRVQHKRHMLAGISGGKRALEYQLGARDLPENRNNPYIRSYSKEEADKLRKDNEYDNFLKRMLFKLQSVGAGEPSFYNTHNMNDERNTIDSQGAFNYKSIWNSLTPAEKDQVIAASGHPEYTSPAKLAKYLPKPAPKSQVENPHLNLGIAQNRTGGGDRKKLKAEMFQQLTHKKNALEKEIETPAKGPKSYEKGFKYWGNPGRVPTEKEADELRKELDREIFEKRKLFKLERGHDKRYKDPEYPSAEFSHVWKSMSPAEKDEYMAQEMVGMSPEYIRKKYGVPSLIDALPKVKKPTASGPKKSGAGSRAFEKEKLLSEIKAGDEELKNKIHQGIIPKQTAEGEIRKHEYDNFLKRQQFKFNDASYQSTLANNPFDYSSEFHEELFKRIPDTRQGAAPVSGPNWQARQVLYNGIEPYVKAKESAHWKKIEGLKDPRAREDVAGAKAYAEIWNKLTPDEKNQVMQAEAYTPKGIEYYMPAVSEPPMESKASQEEVVVQPSLPREPISQAPHEEGAAISPNLFQAPIPPAEYAESQKRLKEERRYRREAKEQRELWDSLTPQQKNEAKLATQIGEYNQLARQAPFMEMQAMLQNQGMNPAMLNQVPPAMMQEMMQYQNQPQRQVPVRPRRSVYDRIMSSFDPNLFSPEFTDEET